MKKHDIHVWSRLRNWDNRLSILNHGLIIWDPGFGILDHGIEIWDHVHVLGIGDQRLKAEVMDYLTCNMITSLKSWWPIINPRSKIGRRNHWLIRFVGVPLWLPNTHTQLFFYGTDFQTLRIELIRTGCT